MRIIKSTGCTTNNIKVVLENGTRHDLDEIPAETQKEILDKIVKKIGNFSAIYELLDRLEADESDEGQYCDQCGDTSYTNSYNL